MCNLAVNLKSYLQCNQDQHIVLKFFHLCSWILDWTVPQFLFLISITTLLGGTGSKMFLIPSPFISCFSPAPSRKMLWLPFQLILYNVFRFMYRIRYFDCQIDTGSSLAERREGNIRCRIRLFSYFVKNTRCWQEVWFTPVQRRFLSSQFHTLPSCLFVGALHDKP